MASTAPNRRHPAYYSAPVSTFAIQPPDHVLVTLAAGHTHELEIAQRRAWQEEIDILRNAFKGVAGWIYLEFDVPRLGSRIDAVLIVGPAIFPSEFKCGGRQYHIADRNQAWDYGLRARPKELSPRQSPYACFSAAGADGSDAQ